MTAEEETLLKIRSDVPADTFAVGMGVPQLYYELGWDPQIYPTDFPDMNDENLNFIRSELKNQKAVLTSYPDIVPEDFTLRETYVIGPIEFGDYTK